MERWNVQAFAQREAARAPVRDSARSPATRPETDHRGSSLMLLRLAAGTARRRGETADSGSSQSSLRSSDAETGLAMSQPGDASERDADRMAAAVMGGGRPESPVGQPGGERGRGYAVPSPTASVVREVLSSPGQPLEPGARAYMEPRFGRDLGGVRVHHDARAAHSADAVDARAYAVGNDLVFARGEYAPGTARGRSILAHELAHVVQQRGEGGLPPMLRRMPKVSTWAGDFIADEYVSTRSYSDESKTRLVGYGANIKIRFRANDRVDATKIAFVQTALSVKNGAPYNKYDNDEKEKKVAGGRMIPAGKPGAGVHVDQRPPSRSPLYGVTGGDTLASPVAGPYTEIGFHYKDAGKPKNQDAVLTDEPDLNSGDIYVSAEDAMKGEWSQRFESTALAIAGNQAGTYYGSVEWGWARGPSDTTTRLLDFKAKPGNIPTPTFMDAARLWNASTTTEQKDTFDLPVEATTSKVSTLWDTFDRGKAIVDLPLGTPVARTSIMAPKGKSFIANVVVTGGAHAGKTGWIMEIDLYRGERK